jgi:hypothetical protein
MQGRRALLRFKLLIVIGQHTTGPSSEHSTLASNRPSRASSLIEAAIRCCSQPRFYRRRGTSQ